MRKTTPNLYCDQTPSREGSMYLFVMAMAWNITAGPRTMTAVESIKMIVVIPNKNMCSRQRNTGPLELQERAKKGTFERSRRDESIGNESTYTQKYPD